jgi:hypothetical protein
MSCQRRGADPSHDEPDPGVAESPVDPALKGRSPRWNRSEGLRVLKA